MQIKIKGQTLLLLPEKAIYWEEEQTLIISDLHLGKVSYFRKEGIPVPSGGIDKNFNRLNHLLSHYDVRRIIFTGDLFHGKENKEWELFKSWRKEFPNIRMDIVMGNHDLLSASHYSGASVSVSNCDLRISPFTFCHHPQEEKITDEYFICGHIHPVFTIHGMAGQRMRLPCFYFGRTQAVLPSFGFFTGGFEIKKSEKEKVFVVADNSVIEVKG